MCADLSWRHSGDTRGVRNTNEKGRLARGGLNDADLVGTHTPRVGRPAGDLS
jgi:hypothetical protein